jgi:hypothetical protein
MKVLNRALFLSLFQVVLCTCHCTEINFMSFNSIDEIIEFETAEISKINSEDYEGIADAYASRGESLLLIDHFEEALADFQNSYEFGIKLCAEKSATSTEIIFRALFGQAIAYANLNELEYVCLITDKLKEIMRSVNCSRCKNKSPQTVLNCSKINAYIFSSTMQIENVPIYGPEQISLQDCLDLIDNTVALSKLLIAKAPASARAPLTVIIDQLAQEARKCCRRGGLWKGCFQKLANKYHQWNQKWMVLGIPPDPSWD